ncbi:nucleotidyl transferase AbiEii/AbiGii toxin family protein [Mesorhizobium sp. M1A.F.Ca.IN.020.30.1.1]|uniref:nucleotidyl transferase AbiEii/AbiGii toxin family protein n=1 Tax=Mesorhizobium sp. M1A.F.Ca.IN.020.30.1.1 TaxID=2496762 RepID=UPI0032AEA2FE
MTTVNAPCSVQLDDAALADCFADLDLAKQHPAHVSAFLGEVPLAQQVEFATAHQLDMIADARPNGGGFFVLYRPDRPASRECRGYDFEWSFGGGTAMMIQIGHRESHDIDIFLDDPQLLGHRPSKSHLHFETMPSDYLGDGLRFQKFAFEDVGEIDFIVAGALTTKPF